AMTVTFLPASDTVLGRRNGVQVMAEIQPTRSVISVSGLRLSLMGMFDGYFLHWLNSFSPGTSIIEPAAPDTAGAAAGLPGAGVTRGVGIGPFSLPSRCGRRRI